MPTPTDIKLLRKTFGETRKEFAERFNVSQSLVESWELGRRPMKGAAVKLYEIYQQKAIKELNKSKENA